MTAIMDLASNVISIVGDRAEAEAFVSGGTSALTRFANSSIHQNVAEEGVTISLRVAVDGRVLSATTNASEGDRLERFVESTLEAARLQPVDDSWPGLTPSEAGYPGDHFDIGTANTEPDERAEQVKAFVDAGPGLLAAGYCETNAHTLAFVNSAGHRLEGMYTAATIDGIHQTPTSAGSAHQASSRFDDLDGAATGALAAQRARDSADAFDLKPGEYEVVLAPEVVATLAVFLAGYGLQAKAFQEGQSFAVLGEQQFDEALTIVDDATDDRAIGLWFDTEGTHRSPVTLVGDGVTSALAHDRRTAARAGVVSTGHGYPGSEVWGPFPDSMFVSGGDKTVDELIASVDRGLYVATFNYCRVLEPKSLVVTGLTRNGTFMIENGAITGAVTGLRFTQSFVAGLAPGAILGVANDARHADSEFGANVVHAPSVHLASWNFTGGASG